MAQIVIKFDLNKYAIDGQEILVIDTVEKTAPAKGGIRVQIFLVILRSSQSESWRN